MAATWLSYVSEIRGRDRKRHCAFISAKKTFEQQALPPSTSHTHRNWCGTAGVITAPRFKGMRQVVWRDFQSSRNSGGLTETEFPNAANTAAKVCSKLAFNSFCAFVLTQLVLSLHIYGSGNSVQKSRPFDSTVETVRKVRQRCGLEGWAA